MSVPPPPHSPALAGSARDAKIEAVAFAMRTYDRVAGDLKTWRELAAVAVAAGEAFDETQQAYDMPVRSELVRAVTQHG